MAKLLEMPPLITQRILRGVVTLLQCDKAELRQDGRDYACRLMRLLKQRIPQEEGPLEIFESADGEIRVWKNSEHRSVGSGVCLDGSLPRWPR